MADPVIPRIGEAKAPTERPGTAGDGLAPRRQPTITVNPKPLRDVVKAEYVGGCRYTGYVHKSIRLTLSCGHEMTRKASAGVPRRAGCHDCWRDNPTKEIPDDPQA